MFTETALLKPLTDNSGFLMLLGLILTLVICFIIDVNHYTEMYGANIPTIGFLLGILQALFIESLRFISAIAGIKEFSEGKKVAGFFGMFLSFLLTLYVCIDYVSIANAWTIASPEFASSIHLGLQAPVWVGLILEIRMVLNASTKTAVAKK